MSDLHQSSGAPTLVVMRERLQHLATAENLENDNGLEYARWADTRLERWLVDWALRNGKENTAKQLAEERGLEVIHIPFYRPAPETLCTESDIVCGPPT